MQPVWIYLLSGRRFEETFEHTHTGESPTNADYATLYHLIQTL